MGGTNDERGSVYIRINDSVTAVHLKPLFRQSVPEIIAAFRRRYSLSLLSGDNSKQGALLKSVFGNKTKMLFEQKPIDKLQYIELLQREHNTVVMIGDGLNDAGALQQSDVGITIADDINNFTPSCDAILEADKFHSLPSLFKLARCGRLIIGCSFVVSVIYNVIGLYFAMKGEMKPVIAAILMPCSTLSIVIITSGLSSVIAWRYGLKTRQAK